MDEQGTLPSLWTSYVVVITLELVADEEEGDPALITAIGRETATTLQHDGSTLRPVYTGQRGGLFVVGSCHRVDQPGGQGAPTGAAMHEGDKALLDRWPA